MHVSMALSNLDGITRLIFTGSHFSKRSNTFTALILGDTLTDFDNIPGDIIAFDCRVPLNPLWDFPILRIGRDSDIAN